MEYEEERTKKEIAENSLLCAVKKYWSGKPNSEIKIKLIELAEKGYFK